jgi:hypothetical protein
MANRHKKGWRYTGPRAGLSWLGIGKQAETGVDGGGSSGIVETDVGLEDMSGGGSEMVVDDTSSVVTPAEIEAPNFKVKGFGNHLVNVLTKGQLSRDANNANMQVGQAAYENKLRAALAAQNNEAMLSRMQQLKELEQSGALARIQAEEKSDIAKALAAESYKRGVTPNRFSSDIEPTTLMQLENERAKYRSLQPEYGTDRFAASKVASMYADDAKQGALNEKVLADTALTEAQAAMVPWLEVGPNQARVNTATGEEVRNIPPAEFKPEFMGGISRGKPVKRPGGVNAEFGAGTGQPPSAVNANPIPQEFRINSNPPPDKLRDLVNSFKPQSAPAIQAAPGTVVNNPAVVSPPSIEDALDILLRGGRSTQELNMRKARGMQY